MITLTLFGVQLEMFLRRQDLVSWMILGLTVLLIVVASVWCNKLATGERKPSKISDETPGYY
jgi:hypothetical protein